MLFRQVYFQLENYNPIIFGKFFFSSDLWFTTSLIIKKYRISEIFRITLLVFLKLHLLTSIFGARSFSVRFSYLHCRDIFGKVQFVHLFEKYILRCFQNKQTYVNTCIHIY